MGSGRLLLKSQFRFTHRTRRSIGLSGLGASWKELRLNFFPHQGQFSSGIGEGFRSSFRNAMVFAQAEYGSFSPFLPLRFGVAACPTQSPISNGHSPNLSTSFWRSSSSAQINVDARLNWSRVRRRSVYLISTLRPA